MNRRWMTLLLIFAFLAPSLLAGGHGWRGNSPRGGGGGLNLSS